MAARPRLLLVDDRRANILALEGVLAGDYELLPAYSGEEAISLLRRNPDIDVILLDVQMPTMDGYEVARIIKGIDALKEIPIVFITAVYNDDPDVRRGYDAGGVDYFGKPFDPDVLKLKLRIYSTFRNREKILRQRELQIRESEELLRVGRKLSAVLEDLPFGVLIADVDGRICQTTEAVAQILGSTAASASDSYGEIIGWWDGEGRILKDEGGPLLRAIRDGDSSHSEPISIRRVDGTAKSILVSASPLRGLDDRLVGAVVLLQDMTEPRKIEQALEDRVTRLINLGVQLDSQTRPFS